MKFRLKTTAMILGAGETEASEFYTLFGRTGSSGITGKTGDSALDSYDDVVQIRNVSFEGDILSAQVTVKFLDTADTGKLSTESVFQYSNGFEDFAVVGSAEATLLESANYGVTEAPSEIVFTDSSNADDFNYVPGTPAPPMVVLAMLGGLLVIKFRHGAR
jgi:hypothetical protein